MSADEQQHRDFHAPKAHDDSMASDQEEEAAGAAWEGADLERPLEGENPESGSLEEARRWVTAYSHLVKLEQDLMDLMASMITKMPEEARKEAEDVNLPLLAAQLERFRHRLSFWSKRRAELEQGQHPG
jgi:hypothetical protein